MNNQTVGFQIEILCPGLSAMFNSCKHLKRRQVNNIQKTGKLSSRLVLMIPQSTIKTFFNHVTVCAPVLKVKVLYHHQ